MTPIRGPEHGADAIVGQYVPSPAAVQQGSAGSAYGLHNVRQGTGGEAATPRSAATQQGTAPDAAHGSNAVVMEDKGGEAARPADARSARGRWRTMHQDVLAVADGEEDVVLATADAIEGVVPAAHIGMLATLPEASA